MASLLETPAGRFVRKMGLFKTPFDTARTNLRDWLEQTKGRQGYEVTEQLANGSLQAALQSLLPLTVAAIERRLLIACDGAWTAYMDNLEGGTDRSAVAAMSRRMRCDAVHFGADKDAVILTVYGPEQNSSGGNTVRDLRAFRDMGGWEFKELGTPLPFEDTSTYRSPSVKDRFTIGMLGRYLLAMGMRPFEEDFYRTSETCLLITRKARKGKT
jgi:hypothetical protein